MQDKDRQVSFSHIMAPALLLRLRGLLSNARFAAVLSLGLFLKRKLLVQHGAHQFLHRSPLETQVVLSPMGIYNQLLVEWRRELHFEGRITTLDKVHNILPREGLARENILRAAGYLFPQGLDKGTRHIPYVNASRGNLGLF